jgi:hypothetical protein
LLRTPEFCPEDLTRIMPITPVKHQT